MSARRFLLPERLLRHPCSPFQIFFQSVKKNERSLRRDAI